MENKGLSERVNDSVEGVEGENAHETMFEQKRGADELNVMPYVPAKGGIQPAHFSTLQICPTGMVRML